MKTTIELPDAVLREAKKLANRRGTSLKAVIEQALRETIERDKHPAKKKIEIRTAKGKGLQPGLSWGNWSAIRDLAYEGHGA